MILAWQFLCLQAVSDNRPCVWARGQPFMPI